MLKTLPELLAMASANVRTITAKQAQQEIGQSNGMIIDVREPAEFAKQAAKGSVNMPRGVLEGQIINQIKDENFAIYLHCAAGFRATLAAESVQKLGYKNVTAIGCKFADVETAFGE